MILHLVPELNKFSIILASGSPRRKEILDKIGLKFEVISSTFEENYKLADFEDANAFAIATAEGKAYEVRDRLVSAGRIPDLVIGCDTCIYQDGQIFGKPKTEEETGHMIKRWSSRPHDVISGVCMLYTQTSTSSDTEWHKISFYETTTVTFDSPLSVELVEAYIKTGDAGDKAGGYGIQGVASCLVRSISGCYYNVMGLPLNHFCRKLAQIRDLIRKH